MTPALTDADREALDRIQIVWTDSPASSDGTHGMRVLLETIASQFLAAGMERAAKVCDDEALTYGPMNHRTMANAARACAAAIREQAKGG